MTRRSTIGTNPLDVVVPNPLESTIADQRGTMKEKTHQGGNRQRSVGSSAGEHSATTPVLHTNHDLARNPPSSLESGLKGKPKVRQKNVAQPARLGLEPLPPSGELADRLFELEQENFFLKWALGLVLAPVAVLVLFA